MAQGLDRIGRIPDALAVSPFPSAVEFVKRSSAMRIVKTIRPTLRIH